MEEGLSSASHLVMVGGGTIRASDENRRVEAAYIRPTREEGRREMVAVTGVVAALFRADGRHGGRWLVPAPVATVDWTRGDTQVVDADGRLHR